MGSLVQQAQRAYATWKAANSPAGIMAIKRRSGV